MEQQLYFDISTQELFTHKGEVIKRVVCPLNAEWYGMYSIENSPDRLCELCSKPVVDTGALTLKKITELVLKDPGTCLKISPEQQNITFVCSKFTQPEGMRVIKTAHTENEMNEAVLAGYDIMIMPTYVSPTRRENQMMYQHPETGFCELTTDSQRAVELERLGYSKFSEQQVGIFDTPPFAAYIVPRDLELNERVWLEECIDAYPAHFSLPAFWDGYHFNTGYIRITGYETFIG